MSKVGTTAFVTNPDAGFGGLFEDLDVGRRCRSWETYTDVYDPDGMENQRYGRIVQQRTAIVNTHAALFGEKLN